MTANNKHIFTNKIVRIRQLFFWHLNIYLSAFVNGNINGNGNNLLNKLFSREKGLIYKYLSMLHDLLH